MVRHDNVKSDRFGVCDLIDRRDTRIDGNDKRRSALSDGMECTDVQSVPFTFSRGDIIIHVNAAVL